MFAVQDRLTALHIVVDAHMRQVLRRRLGPGNGHGFPRPIAHPGPLLLPCVFDIVESHRLAVLFQFVLHLAGQGQGLWPGQVDATILQLAAVQHGHGNQTAGIRFARLAGPLQHRDGSQFGRGVVRLRQLPRVLRPHRQRGQQACQGHMPHRENTCHAQ